MKKIFAIAAILTSLMLFGCKGEEPKQPSTTESTTTTMKSSTTTTPVQGEQDMEKTTETEEVIEKTIETQPAPVEAQK